MMMIIIIIIMIIIIMIIIIPVKVVICFPAVFSTFTKSVNPKHRLESCAKVKNGYFSNLAI